MIAKDKRIRLKDKALAKLNSDIYERDGGVCIICGRFVMPGTKFHHYKQGANKEDIIENGVLLCNECHYQAHFGEVQKYKEKVGKYLNSLYEGGGNSV